MRILFLSNYYPPRHFGGYEELCQDVAIGLRDCGHQVTILTSRHAVDLGKADNDPQVIRSLESEVAVGDPLATPRLIFGRSRRETRNRLRLNQVLERTQPDVAMVWGMWNLSPDLGRCLEEHFGQRLLYYVADDWPTLPAAVVQHLHALSINPVSMLAKSALARFLPRSNSRLASSLQMSHVACVSGAVRRILADADIRVGEIEVIHNGINIDQFKIPATVTPPPNSPLRLILIGRLTAEKGVLIAVQAFVQSLSAGHELSLSLVGDISSETRSRVLKILNAAGVADSVHWIDRQPRSAIAGILADHHVLLVPSQGTDALPRTAQEGMAMGLAVVASRLGGIPELIDDGLTGLLVPPGDCNALATAIGRLASDDDFRRQLAESGRQRVETDFDIRQTVARIERRLLSLTVC